MRVTVVRHGNTFATGEPALRIGRRSDLPLVASGEAQAALLRSHFKQIGWRFDRVLAAPLRRTMGTAEIVAPNALIEPMPWLSEIDHGPDEARTEAEVLARIGPAALMAWESDAIVPSGWAVDNGLLLREWRRLIEQPGEGHVLVVTSNGIARFALLSLAGSRPAGLKLRTGAYGVIDDGKLIEWDVRPPQ